LPLPKFEVRQSAKTLLTSCAGVALIGQCCEAAQVDLIVDPRMPVSQGMRTSDIVKSAIGLLSMGKSDFDAIEPLRGERFFKQALGLSKVPSSAWMRQRLDAVAGDLREIVGDLTLRLLQRTEAPVTPHQGFVCVDVDTFAMDNSGTRKEHVGRTYQGFDGYTPIAAYLGNEGWCLGLELRSGTHHSALETDHFLERIFPRAEGLAPAQQPTLWRMDSGFDSVKLLFTLHAERQRLARLGRKMDYIVKWNPRKQDKAQWVQQAQAAGAFVTEREGKRVALLSAQVQRKWGSTRHTLRLITQVTERTIDKRGQMLLTPEIELQGWWTTLDAPPEQVIKLYQHHGTHEQFHSEIKTDLDLERLPSGKFDTNDAILHLAGFTYNCLRLLGQLGLTGQIAPIRHPAKRRRLKTVLQEILYRAAKVVEHARRLVLDFGRGVAAHVQVFAELQKRLVAAASP